MARYQRLGTQILDTETGQRWPATRSLAIELGLIQEAEQAAAAPAPQMRFTVAGRHERQPAMGSYKRTTTGKVKKR